QEQRRIQKDRVGVGEQRLSSRGRLVDERDMVLGPGAHRDSAPGPVSNLRVAKDQPTGSQDLGKQWQSEKKSRGEAEQESPSPGRHRGSVRAVGRPSSVGNLVLGHRLSTIDYRLP